MISSFKPQKLSEAALQLIAERFKALSQPVRLKLILALHDGERNVTDLVKATARTQTNVSRHLHQLVESGVLTRRREGTCIYYRIADPAIFELCRHVCGSLLREMEETGKASALFRV